MPTYNPNIPTGTINLNEDYLNLQANFKALDDVYQQDHVPLTDTTVQKGYHTAVHLAAQGSTPAGALNTFMLLDRNDDDGYNTWDQLIARPGTNSSYPLTRNFTPDIALEGRTFLAGGLVIMWGRFNLTKNTEQTYLFPDAFINNCYNVQLTMKYAPSDPPSSDSLNYAVGAVSNLGFDFIVNTVSTKIIQAFYLALGN